MTPFTVDSDDGRAVVLTFTDWRIVEGASGDARLAVLVRLDNADAADLLAALRHEVGEWAAEREQARVEFNAGIVPPMARPPECPECDGRGWVFSQAYRPEVGQDGCPECGGRGVL